MLWIKQLSTPYERLTMVKVKEDSAGAFSAAPNAAGSGGVEGIGVGPKGEPGVYPKKKKLRVLFPMIKRKTLQDLSQWTKN